VTAIAAVVGYLMGSIPTASFLGRLRGIDLRLEGSRNPGAANALRTSGPRLAATVLVVEAAKGYVAVLAGSWVGDETGAVAAGLGAVAGNVYNIWYRFQGGKGLGISLGVLAALWPAVILPVGVAIALGALVSRSSGIASLVAVATLIVLAYLWRSTQWPTGGVEPTMQLIVLAVGISLIISWKHWRAAGVNSPASH
jgi:acyl phosphate:glycerol-3-phosphate acyltransferase